MGAGEWAEVGEHWSARVCLLWLIVVCFVIFFRCFKAGYRLINEKHEVIRIIYHFL